MKQRLGEEVDQSLLDEIAEEEAKLQAIGESRKNAFQTIFTDLSKDIGKLIADEKKKTLEEEQLLNRFATILNKIDEIKETQPEAIPIIEPVVIVEEVVVEKSAILAPPETPSLAAIAAKQIKAEAPPSMFVQPEPPLVSRDIRDIQGKLKMLEGWVSKIAMAGPGGGEVNLRYLDDVARDTIADGKWLRYDASRKKFIFDDINPGEIVNNTTIVTGDTYVVSDTDWYIGVNYAGPVTITLPAVATTGRVLVIKDESGACESNPITALGTVDNDAGGFILRINNGAIQMTYRSGWRVI